MSVKIKNNEVQIGKKVFMRDAGKDEHWLQDMLYENPSSLGLCNYPTLGKGEKREASNGRFHITLQDLIYDLSYEVEVMLGEIDAAHIITALEYWDNMERKGHRTFNYAVLVAESLEGRYYNLLHTLGMHLPMIFIQANLLEVNKEYILSFSNIINLHSSPHDSEKTTTVDESVWSEKAPWTLKAAKELYSLIDADDKSIDYKEDYINIRIQGRRAYRLEKSSEPNSIALFTVFDDEKVNAIRDIFYNICYAPYNLNRNKEFVIPVNEDMIRGKKALFQEILKIRYKELLSHR
ncbi:MAG: hypothetical protein V1766_15705 [Pseudomonadota bacterium]